MNQIHLNRWETMGEGTTLLQEDTLGIGLYENKASCKRILLGTTLLQEDTLGTTVLQEDTLGIGLQGNKASCKRILLERHSCKRQALFPLLSQDCRAQEYPLARGLISFRST